MDHLIHIEQTPRAAEKPPLHRTSNDAGFKIKHGDIYEQSSFSSDFLTKLDNEYNEVARTLQAFNKNVFPDGHRDLEQDAPTNDDVLQVVRQAEATRASSTHGRHLRWSTLLLESCTTSLNAHSVLLCAFPRGERYRSLLYRALQSVIKASAGYYKVAEGLSQALIEINEAVFSIRDVCLDESLTVLCPVATLYSQIFLFFGEFMYWYTKKAKCRLLQSHHQDFYSDLQYLVQVIRGTCSSINLGLLDTTHLAVAIGMKGGTNLSRATLYQMEEARLSQAGLKGTDRHVASQNTIIRQLLWEIQKDASERKRMADEKDILLSQLFHLLEQKVHSFDKRGKDEVAVTATTLEDIAQVIPSIASPRISKRKVSRVELELSSKDLQDFFSNDDQLLNLELPLEIYADPSVITTLREWTLGSLSQVLTIACPSVTSFPCPATILSGYYTYSARRAGLPVISHFCSPSLQTSSGNSPAAHGLVALVYSLIRQLIELAPPVLDCEISSDPSAERFRKLDGTLNTWEEAISVLDTLLNFMPPLLFCIIGGLDVLHDESTERCLQSLVRTLVRRTTRPSPASTHGGPGTKPAMLKVLFSASGSPAVLSEIPPHQIIITDSLRIGRAPEHPIFSDPDTVSSNCSS